MASAAHGEARRNIPDEPATAPLNSITTLACADEYAGSEGSLGHDIKASYTTIYMSILLLQGDVVSTAIVISSIFGHASHRPEHFMEYLCEIIK